jgi:hypothetical protein
MLADALSLLFPETSRTEFSGPKEREKIDDNHKNFEGEPTFGGDREEIMFCFYLIHTPNLHNTSTVRIVIIVKVLCSQHV